MTRESILIIIGILIALSPWSGLPLAWLTWFLLPAGVLVAVIAFTLRPRRQKTTERPAPSQLS